MHNLFPMPKWSQNKKAAVALSRQPGYLLFLERPVAFRRRLTAVLALSVISA
jgi:hypothetical protein